jgi:Flp pilus assembly protein TadD
LLLRRFDEAMKYNQYAAAERPDDALANSQLGQNYFYLGDFEKA